MDYSSVVLDRANGPSLYLQLAESLASAAASGGLTLGERLPSERELAGVLGVSRTTVVAAYRELEARGLARGHVGRGTFVVGGVGEDDEGAPFAWRGKLAARARRFLDPALRALVDEAPPGTVSFGPGVPALDRFPTEGHPALREAIAARSGARPGEVLVAPGRGRPVPLVPPLRARPRLLPLARRGRPRGGLGRVGAAVLRRRGGERHVRLCYAGAAPADIERGVARLLATASLHPAVVIIASVTVAGAAFGVLGALLAVPVAVVVGSLAETLWFERLEGSSG